MTVLAETPRNTFNALGRDLKRFGRQEHSGHLRRVFVSDDQQFALLLYTRDTPLQGTWVKEDTAFRQGVFDSILKETGAAGVYATQIDSEIKRLKASGVSDKKLKILNDIAKQAKNGFPGVLIAVEMDYDFYPRGSLEKMSHDQ